MSNSRAVAARVLASLMAQQGSLSTLLDKHKDGTEDQLVQEMVYGCCRWYQQLEFLLAQLLSKPLKHKDLDVKALLLIGLYQLREMRVPDHAAINETVAAVSALHKPWARGLVNAVLRNYQRREPSLSDILQTENDAIRHSHPQWLAAALKSSWPDHYSRLLSGNNQRPPMTLRVNLARVAQHDYLNMLLEQGINASVGRLSPAAIYLEQALAVSSLPGFSEGLVSVQDEASQMVPPMLDLAPDQRVLDACAAPGGKTCHILESECSLTEIVAIERDAARIVRIEENLKRLQLQARLLQADANNVSGWWDGKPFDRILLDAPCSATGVIRRHPDIKLLLKGESVDDLSGQQEKLLRSLWPCLRPGGLLLYTTCSILPQENSRLIQRFLSDTVDAKYEGVAADWGVECDLGKQLLPLDQRGPDGFFYSLLRKT